MLPYNVRSKPGVRVQLDQLEIGLAPTPKLYFGGPIWHVQKSAVCVELQTRRGHVSGSVGKLRAGGVVVVIHQTPTGSRVLAGWSSL
jgi:hypothetical protein